MDAETTRERIARRLREESLTASDLAEAADTDRSTAVDHVRHVARSVDDGEVLVAPPTCRECGFDEFDRPANLPSRCPECKSEAIDEPEFTIQ